MSQGRVSPDDNHKDVWSSYIRGSDHSFRKIGISGDRLKLARHRADYDSDYVMQSGDSRKALEDAQQILWWLEGI